MTVIEDDSSVVGECIKISGYHPNGVAEIAPPFQQKWGGKLHCDIAGRDWLDFTMVNTGDGIRALAEALDIPLADIAAFGDQFNDDSLLQLVGHPYIMASAPEPLLKKRYAVCERVMDTLILPKDYGYPVCSIEKEYINAASGQLRTRFQAFVESLELKMLREDKKNA